MILIYQINYSLRSCCAWEWGWVRLLLPLLPLLLKAAALLQLACSCLRFVFYELLHITLLLSSREREWTCKKKLVDRSLLPLVATAWVVLTAWNIQITKRFTTAAAAAVAISTFLKFECVFYQFNFDRAALWCESHARRRMCTLIIVNFEVAALGKCWVSIGCGRRCPPCTLSCHEQC